MKPYSVLAKYYDKLNYDCDYDKWSQYLCCLLEEHFQGQKGLKGIDGACGCGRITIELNKAGYGSDGFDISEDMLRKAYINAQKSGISVNFLKADLINFKAHKKLDFINISNDGINYVNRESLLKCFNNCYNNLKKGGLLLFDISSEYKLLNTLANNVFFDDNDEVTFIWNNSLRAEVGEIEMDLIFFVREGVKYLRFDENHIQYIYKSDYIKGLLREVGFNSINVYDFCGKDKPQEKSLRIQFTAAKICL